MKYKVGDQVLIKAKLVSSGYNIHFAKTEKGKFSLAFRDEDVVPAPDMTAEEAWEIAKKLFSDYSNIVLDEIFGKGWSFPKLMELTPRQAKSKIEAWESRKEIKVGDFVEFEDKIFCVTRLAGEYCCGMDANGSVYSTKKKETKKTGRRIDIEGLLKQIGGDE